MDIARLGTARVEFDRLTIQGDAGRYSVEPKVLEVLRVLIDNQGDVVSREAIIDLVWGVSYGGDERLSRAISLLRKALGDKRGNHRYILTVPRRGYRLRTKLTGSDAAFEPADRSLAVLPFADHSAAENSAFLADGLCRDLTNLLSRVPHQRVAPHSSAVRFAADEQPLQAIARELNIRYLITGTVLAVERDVRLRLSVSDGITGEAIWSRKSDASLDQFYQVQDDLVLAIATTINSEVEVAGLKHLLARSDFDLTAYEHIQAAEAARWTYSRTAAEKIVMHLRAALEIDPDNPFVHAALAVQLSQNIASLWTEDPAKTFTEAKDHLCKAQALAPNEPDVLIAAGILTTMTGRADEAVPPLTRAVDLDPNNPHARALYGWQLCLLERDPRGVELIESAERDAPHHPRYGNWAAYRGHAEMRLGNYDASLRGMEDGIARMPNYHHHRASCAFTLVLMGRMDEATARIREALDREPRITLEQVITNMERHVFQTPPGMTMDECTALFRQVWPK